MNAKNSQLIATRHNREILNNRDVFRDDVSSVIRDTSNILNAYKSGRLKGTPNLGDYFIDL